MPISRPSRSNIKPRFAPPIATSRASLRFVGSILWHRVPNGSNCDRRLSTALTTIDSPFTIRLHPLDPFERHSSLRPEGDLPRAEPAYSWPYPVSAGDAGRALAPDDQPPRTGVRRDAGPHHGPPQ